MKNLLVGAGFAWCLAAPVSAAVFECSRDEVSICERGAGCRSAGPRHLYLRIDFDANIYDRCSADQCDRHPIRVTTVGDFLNLAVPDVTIGATVGPMGELTEVVYQGSTVMVAYGQCLQVEP